ncbi:toxin-antitoxin system YwqK family antitoxin [Psychroflexus tropicus]|uniref:toxin-antitoxin system YwqK family antitoxin n=1 Tax=Psychroflexus tropicus TaxID=197345 RepID=UPI00037F57D8|nr:hypothetical protein [Psychroflexus tropicus]
MKIYITLICLLISLSGGRLDYVKSFYDNGNLKAEGWIKNELKQNYWYYYYPQGHVKSKGKFQDNKKAGYWFYYNETGLKTKEGHYKNGMATSWWNYYKEDTIVSVELVDGKREGLALYKVNGKPVKAEYYVKGERTHEWFSLKEFRENPIDL